MAPTPGAKEIVHELDQWANTHRPLFEEAWLRAGASGQWPEAEKLTRNFFAKRQRIDVAAVAATMPVALGHLEQGRVALTVRGASYYPGAKRHLVRYVRACALAVSRYKNPRGDPDITVPDLVKLGISKTFGMAKFRLIAETETWALRPITGSGNEQRWRIDSQAALALGSAKTLPKYLEAQANAWWSKDSPQRHLTAFGPGYLSSREAQSQADVEEEWEVPRGLDEAELWWLHPVIASECGQLLSHGHYREGVERATAVFQRELRKRSGLTTDGAALVHQALSPTKPGIVVADTETRTGKHFQEGIHHLASGAIAAIRNPTAHSLSDPTADAALEQLAILSFLIRVIDESDSAE